MGYSPIPKIASNYHERTPTEYADRVYTAKVPKDSRGKEGKAAKLEANERTSSATDGYLINIYENALKSGTLISVRSERVTNERSERLIRMKPKELLILSPEAYSTAGEGGTAVSIPLSRAVIKRGHNVDIIFDPRAVAVAGPGGIAHSQSNLIVDVFDK
jgi:hypothetical protein